MISWQRPTVSCLAVALAVLHGTAGAVGGAAAPAPLVWRATYVSGTAKVRPNAHVRLEAREDRLTGSRYGRELFRIPSDQIVEISYDSGSHRPARSWVRAAGDLPTGDPLAAVAAAFMLLGGAILAPVTTTRHFVRIAWLDGGERREALLRVNADDREAILAELSRLSGEPSRNSPEERARVVERIQAGEGEQLLIALDRNVLLPGSILRSGSYCLAALENEVGLVDLYFFKGGKLDPGKLAGHAVAGRVPAVDHKGGTKVWYLQEDGVAVIAEIHSPKAVYRPARLSPVAGEADSPKDGEIPAKSFGSEEGQVAVIARVQHEGEPAYRLPVLHSWPVSTGFIYVTPTRLVYDPCISPGHDHRLVSVARSEEPAVHVVLSMGAYKLRVNHGAAADQFCVLFASGEGLGFLVSPSREKRQPEFQALEWLVGCWNDFSSCERAVLGDPAPIPEPPGPPREDPSREPLIQSGEPGVRSLRPGLATD